jgi:hypothetical protein
MSIFSLSLFTWYLTQTVQGKTPAADNKVPLAGKSMILIVSTI